MISESEFKAKYESNPGYIYEIISRGINKEDQYNQFVSKIKENNTRTNLLDNYVYSALIVDKLQNKNKNNEELRDLKQFFITGLQEHGKKGKDPVGFNSYVSKNRVLESFNKKYGFHLLNTVINNIIS